MCLSIGTTHDCRSIYLYCYCLHVYLNQVFFFFGSYTSEGVICTCPALQRDSTSVHPSIVALPLAVLHHVHVIIRTRDGGLVLL